MRKITKKATAAFMGNSPFKLGNTEVKVTPDVTILYLHGNSIAYKWRDDPQTLHITNAGWGSATTKERLNGLPGVYIRQRAGLWYLNGKPWDGKLTEVR